MKRKTLQSRSKRPYLINTMQNRSRNNFKRFDLKSRHDSMTLIELSEFKIHSDLYNSSNDSKNLKVISQIRHNLYIQKWKRQEDTIPYSLEI